MPNRTFTIRLADETRMPGLFSGLVLKTDGVMLGRIRSRGGLSLYGDHQTNIPMGRVTRGYTDDGAVYVEGELVETVRSRPLIEELDGGLRSGASPGFIIHEARLEDDPDNEGEYVMVVTRWEPYEGSATGIPRNANAGFTRLGGRAVNATAPAQRQAAQDAVEGIDLEKVKADAVRAVRAAWDKVQPGLERYPPMTTDTGRETLKVNRPASDPTARVTASLPAGDATPTWASPADVLGAMLGDEAALGRIDANLIEGVRGQASHARVMFGEQAAIITAGPTSGVGTEAGQVEQDFRDERGILRLFNQATGLTRDQSIPVLQADPSAQVIAEGAARSTPTDVAFGDPALKMSPRIAEVVQDVTLETVIHAPRAYEGVLQAMNRAAANLVVSQVLTGDGQAVNATGLLNVTGVHETEVQGSCIGSADSFFNCEDMLADDVPDTRRLWLLDPSLYKVGRRTSRVAGSAQTVLEDGRVLGGARYYVVDGLGTHVGVYLQASAVTVASWAEGLLTVNRVSKPGEVQLTLHRLFDAVTLRPARVSIYKPA